ncbi:hypothetical protein [Actinomadura sp. 21ATH]|uniref:hypothetical protein n=1 Tax=Actinomadura sp. 21ATH TaxID=1735444 RepID=UPI0035C17118
MAELIGRYARTFGAKDTPEYRREVLRRVETGADPRAARYWELLSSINGWPRRPDMRPVFGWFIEALRTHLDD